jgi:adenylate kinase
MIIALTGTPGCGKTYYAKKLIKHNYNHIELSKIIKKHKLFSGYDKKLKSYIVNQKKLTTYMKKILNKKDNVIVDGHISHLLPKSMIDKVIVLRCKPTILKTRLKKRKYSAEKIRQNVESELIGLIAYEAYKRHKWVCEIDCTKGRRKALNTIISIINSKKPSKKVIDWCR